MAYTATCPVCKQEKFYDNSSHLYLQVQGEHEYVCLDCESILKIRKKVEDPRDSRICYSLEIRDLDNHPPILKNYTNLIKNHKKTEPGYFVQRITWTEL